MKKIVLIFLALLFIASIALNVITIADFDAGGELLIMDKPLTSWMEYIEAEILPKIILAISSLITAYTMFIPLVNRVKGELSKFQSATDYIDSTTKASLNSSKQVSDLKAEMEARLDTYEKSLNEMKAITEKTASILRMGLCNIPELVKNGTAREIAKIGEGEKEQVYEETEI